MTKTFTPKHIWTPNGIVNIDAIKLTNFSGYDFHGATGRVNYAIGAMEGEFFTPLINGSVELPEDVVNAWGEDDTPIIDYVINKLGL